MKIRTHKDIARITVHSLPDRAGEAGRLFDTLGLHNINIELISYSHGDEEKTDISFAVTMEALENVVKILREHYPHRVSYDQEVAMLSLHSDSLGERSGIAGRIFSVLGDNEINIELISTSLNSVTMVIKEKWLEKAEKALEGI